MRRSEIYIEKLFRMNDSFMHLTVEKDKKMQGVRNHVYTVVNFKDVDMDLLMNAYIYVDTRVNRFPVLMKITDFENLSIDEQLLLSGI